MSSEDDKKPKEIEEHPGSSNGPWPCRRCGLNMTSNGDKICNACHDAAVRRENDGDGKELKQVTLMFGHNRLRVITSELMAADLIVIVNKMRGGEPMNGSPYINAVHDDYLNMAAFTTNKAGDSVLVDVNSIDAIVVGKPDSKSQIAVPGQNFTIGRRN
jgi:hypothetical protein